MDRRTALLALGALGASSLPAGRSSQEPIDIASNRERMAPPPITRHGAYVCISRKKLKDSTVAAAPMAERLAQFGFTNEFDAHEGHPDRAFAFARRVDVKARDIADEALVETGAVIHVAAPDGDSVAQFCEGARRLLGLDTRVLSGVVRQPRFTSATMQEFAYGHQLLQGAGASMPNCFLIPMSKTAEWWAKDWMERHTYFLPRYDENGRITTKGHALAAAPGIPALVRRTYRYPVEPAPQGVYDFINYFESSDADVPVFEAVCAALRNTTVNPEWTFVREGPTWYGRRVRTWPELFTEY